MHVRRIAMLAVLLLLALGSVAEGSAYAKEGIFKKGTEELPTKKKFTDTLGATTLQAGGEGSIECKSGSGSGELTSATTATGSILLTGCAFAGDKCKTTGQKAGEVELSEVTAEIVYADSSGTLGPATSWTLPKAGIALTCSSAQSLTIAGSVLASLPKSAGGVSGSNGSALAATFKQSGGVQQYLDYVEKEGGAVKEAGLTTSGTGALNFSNTPTGAETELTINFEEEISVFASQSVHAGVFKKGTEEIPTKKGFTTSLTGSTAEIQVAGELSFECTGGSGSGELTTTTTADSTLKLTGCSYAGVTFHTTGAATGEIVVPEIDLKTVLADQEGVLSPALLWSLPTTLVVHGSNGETIDLSGALLATLPEEAGLPAGFAGSTVPLGLEQSGGYQQYRHYVEKEGGSEHEAQLVASGTGFSEVPAGLRAALSLKLEEEVTLTA